jgi:hypothetical protein
LFWFGLVCFVRGTAHLDEHGWTGLQALGERYGIQALTTSQLR